LTAIVAATIGMTQFDIKRVIAYSTMSQLGYMFFAAGVSAYSAAIFHLMTHAFFKALLFLGAGSVIHALSGEQDMRKMGGIWRIVPFTYAYMWIGSLALAGIGVYGVYGLAGFYSKDLILEAAYADHTWFGQMAYWLGTLAAFLTAFYSWRLLMMTFHGKPRADHHAMEHAHESPWIMLGPLVPLALGAIFAGYIAYDWFAGEERMEHFWREAIKVLPANDTVEAAHHAPLWAKLLPLVAAFSGVLCGWLFYDKYKELPGKIASAAGGVYRLFYNKYYFDELYDRLFVRPANKLGYVFWEYGDNRGIDRFGPDGIAATAVRLAKRFSAIQSGYVYHYAFAMVIGLAIFVTWFWVRG
jgi:NADH-quinone oxidoreductase subunit L